VIMKLRQGGGPVLLGLSSHEEKGNS